MWPWLARTTPVLLTSTATVLLSRCFPLTPTTLQYTYLKARAGRSRTLRRWGSPSTSRTPSGGTAAGRSRRRNTLFEFTRDERGSAVIGRDISILLRAETEVGSITNVQSVWKINTGWAADNEFKSDHSIAVSVMMSAKWNVAPVHRGHWDEAIN